MGGNKSKVDGKYYTNVNGEKISYKDGEAHSYNDQPAVIWPDGKQAWMNNGLQHRDNDRPSFISDRYANVVSA